MKIYTKHGDSGKTDLLGGIRVEKHSPEVALLAAFDELNANLGAARATAPAFNQDILRTQKNMMNIMALIAEPDADTQAPHRNLQGISYKAFFLAETEWLESCLDTMTADGLFNDWVMCGECLESAAIDVARTVCRRTEVLLCGACEAMPRLECVLMYVNRLSDFLYGLARRADKA